MRIAVMGAGAMGCFFGGMLVRAAEDVIFVARGKQLAALNEEGLTITSAVVGDSTMAVQATSEPHAVGAVDVVLFCVKTYDVDSAARAAAPLLGPNTVVLTMQNGVESDRRLATAFGAARVLCGVSWVTANIDSPGVVAHARGTRLVFGEPGNGVSKRVETLNAMFERAGIQAEAHPSIGKAIWEKFMVVCPLGGLSAATRLPLGNLVENEATAALARGLMHEVEVVARARGINLPHGYTAQAYDAFVRLASESPWAYPSMYHDLAAGRRLELDALNGAVDRLGAECGVTTPLNFAIYAALAPYKDGVPAVPSRPPA